MSNGDRRTGIERERERAAIYRRENQQARKDKEIINTLCWNSPSQVRERERERDGRKKRGDEGELTSGEGSLAVDPCSEVREDSSCSGILTTCLDSCWSISSPGSRKLGGSFEEYHEIRTCK